jgi:hypothetical protein
MCEHIWGWPMRPKHVMNAHTLNDPWIFVRGDKSVFMFVQTVIIIKIVTYSKVALCVLHHNISILYLRHTISTSYLVHGFNCSCPYYHYCYQSVHPSSLCLWYIRWISSLLCHCTISWAAANHISSCSFQSIHCVVDHHVSSWLDHTPYVVCSLDVVALVGLGRYLGYLIVILVISDTNIPAVTSVLIFIRWNPWQTVQSL